MATNSMEGNDYSWEKPKCLLENASGQEMQINNETMRLLREIHDPLVVVSIVGLYRTGKSYLMNKLAGKQSGFDLGNTVEAKTKGIWIWCIRHPTKPNTCLALLDTEGLGDVDKGDSKNDVLLFTLAALLSSTLVYNSKGTIDQKAMENIHIVTEIAERLKISSKNDTEEEEDDARLSEFFPNFIWVVRDFGLELKIDGQSITADEYLECALKLKKGASKAVTDFNLPRKCIRRYFPQRKCLTFPPPTTPDKMLSLETLSNNDLLPTFVECTKEFCNHIFENSEPKAIGGHSLNGPKFAGIAVQYAEQISSGKMPSIESAVVSMAKQANEDALQECSKQYRSAMGTFRMPWDDDKLLELHHSQTEKTVRALFFKLAMITDDESKVVSQFTEMINKEYQAICDKNDQHSTEKSEQVLKDLHQDIQKKIDSGAYFKAGGYTAYQKDIADMVKKYLDKPGKGSKSPAVLDKMMKQQFATAKSIMAVDKNMTDAQQKAEENRLQQEVMKKELLEMKQAQERAERRLQEQSRGQQEFMNSMQAKFSQELEVYKKQLTQLKSQLEKERQRLSREGASEDAEQLADYFRALQAREQLRQQTPFRFRFSPF